MKVKLAVTDVCVPISEYAHVIADTERSFAASKTGLVCNIVGHAEDGNFHGMIPFDINNKEMVDELRTLTEQMVKLAISVGGTATGEHGVGLGKAEFLQEEHGEVFLDVMKSIKAAIDPKGIMNPGKIFPQLKVDSITEATNSFAILREGQNGCC
ncbi:hypothetical protein SARC_17259 [Sphaeroforma arctica JP610]|uniref:D-lactate dehydrogenase (cytochrome) n=1 Tax=Sphaeroforma arctica JP610 TaxID=667725 RepID=A0A0L0F0N6_9EUKA|nr:hypothetical protein SARC_17259 [Sphaeroforma arctica JP610]KNC70216.1 hypothetical protein SARC_17259 [Sphaeroforma arctica JP610]|eukprot:XP_014144118.1 hypothetical protein SARC_17259 [Sphaeroforma arctica JP610]